jgi:ubiquinone biosynthesis protein UbiJ
MTDDIAPNPLFALLGRLLEQALARAVALDDDTRGRLAALEGRRVGLDLRGTPLALAVRVDGGALRVGPLRDAPADLGVRASPGSLLAFALRAGSDGALPPGKVEISGDAELARRLETLMRDSRPEVVDGFARTFGDVAGVPLARALLAAFAWTRESAANFVRDGADFLRDDSRDLVAPAELDDFLDAVDLLRERVDRLAARVDRLAARGGPR